MQLTYEWPTEDSDLKFAEKIIDKHLDISGGEPLGVFEIEMQVDRRVDMRLSGWIIELHDHYERLYGEEQGENITRKVVSRCLCRGETRH